MRDVSGKEKLPAFFGAALYLNLSEGEDFEEKRQELLHNIYEVPQSKPPLGASPFVPEERPPRGKGYEQASPPLQDRDRLLEFSERFSLAFPGLRGIQWIDDAEVIAERLNISLQEPLSFAEGYLAGWWRGPRNLHIESFKHVEGSHFQMDVHEFSVRRIAAVGSDLYYRKFLYVETSPDEPTGLYPATEYRDYVPGRIDPLSTVTTRELDEPLPFDRDWHTLLALR